MKKPLACWFGRHTWVSIKATSSHALRTLQQTAHAQLT